MALSIGLFTKPVTKIITIFYGINGIVMLLLFFDVIRTARGWDIARVAKSTEVRNSEERFTEDDQ